MAPTNIGTCGVPLIAEPLGAPGAALGPRAVDRGRAQAICPNSRTWLARAIDAPDRSWRLADGAMRRALDE